MTFEIEVDVPDGWRAVAYRVPEVGEWILTVYGPSQIVCTPSSRYIILERIEPKRVSRWCAMPSVAGGYDTADICRLYSTHSRLCRLDYENGKLVAVTLEPEGEEA